MQASSVFALSNSAAKNGTESPIRACRLVDGSLAFLCLFCGWESSLALGARQGAASGETGNRYAIHDLRVNGGIRRQRTCIYERCISPFALG